MNKIIGNYVLKRLRKLREVIEDGRCSICMDSIRGDKGALECRHDNFCLQCILIWSEVCNKCPLCMQKFFSICNPETRESVAVEDTYLNEETQYLDDIFCEVCRLRDREEYMLICEECERGFHIDCIGIMMMPQSENWFCGGCIRNQTEDVQSSQNLEIMNIRKQELPLKRSKKNFRRPNQPQRHRRSGRLRKID